MRKLISRLAQIAAAAIVITVLAFGGFQMQATAASLDHCNVVPGPEKHCTFPGDCLPECEGASFYDCVDVPGDEDCCMCIW